jgi:hypothetical protein
MIMLDLIYSWQTLLIAALVVLMTQGLKHCIDVALGLEHPSSPMARARSGADLRKQRPVLSHFVLPALPLLLGAFLGAASPWSEHDLPGSWLGARWGLLCGVLGDYAYAHVHDALRAFRDNRAG